MALAAMVTFLEMNGFTWKCGEVEETVMVLQSRRERDEGSRVGSVGGGERGEELTFVLTTEDTKRIEN